MSDAYSSLKENLKNNTKTWLVTGAAGFIGSHLAEQLLELGQKVVGLDSFATGHQHNIDKVKNNVGDKAANYTFIEGDIRNLADCEKAVSAADYVLHQAALGSVPRSIEEPLLSHAANVDGFVNMLDAARREGVKRFVYASSSAVYGDSEALPKTEDQIGNCLSPYATTKRVNELYAQVYERSYNLESIGLRYFNVFGPRQDPNGAYAAVIPRWVDTLRQGETCTVYGDGSTSRDFCYVANVVAANLLAATTQKENATCTAYNIAVGDRTTLNELYGHIAENVKENRGVDSLPRLQYEDFRSGDILHSHAYIDRAEEKLGYSPLVNVQSGLKTTVDWFLNEG